MKTKRKAILFAVAVSFAVLSVIMLLVMAGKVNSLAHEKVTKGFSSDEEYVQITVFLPEYKKYGRAAPILRNRMIVDYADKVIAFWDGCSRGTLSVIKYAESIGKPCEVVRI